MSEWLDALCGSLNGSGRAPSVMIVAAHPDDETISAGGRLLHLRDVIITHITDGAPRDMHDAVTAGFTTREAYARARRGELAAALALGGIGMDQALTIGLVDQEASLDLAGLACRLAELMEEHRPYIVLTHPYEGGHPDHDAASFGVHAAYRLLKHDGGWAPFIVEFASYHDESGRMSTFDFLPCRACDIRTTFLSEAESKIKRQMVECFTTQQRTLAPFGFELERFRPAPAYDFTHPPHAGPLFYERYDWGMVGGRWRKLASEALTQLKLEGAL